MKKEVDGKIVALVREVMISIRWFSVLDFVHLLFSLKDEETDVILHSLTGDEEERIIIRGNLGPDDDPIRDWSLVTGTDHLTIISMERVVGEGIDLPQKLTVTALSEMLAKHRLGIEDVRNPIVKFEIDLLHPPSRNDDGFSEFRGTLTNWVYAGEYEFCLHHGREVAQQTKVSPSTL